MLITRQAVSAVAIATLALTFSAIVSDAQAQFGPMGMGMMGMRGPMGMGRMGTRRPIGMGSARTMLLDGPGYGARSSRSSRNYRRHVDDEPPPRHAKSHAKPARAETAARSIAPVPSSAKRATQHVESKTGLAQPLQNNRPIQTGQPVQPAPVSQPVQTTQAAALVQQAKASQPAASTAAVEGPSTDSALPSRITSDTRPLNCLTKLHLKDGTVLLQDFCTLEQAVIKQGDGSQARQVGTSPASALPQQQKIQPQREPAQLARNR